MAQKTETVFRLRKVVPFLKTLKNTVVFPVQQAAISGTPDFLICCHGLFVALELKSDQGKVSPLQDFNLKRVHEAHGVAITANPKNWPEVRRRLQILDMGEDT